MRTKLNAIKENIFFTIIFFTLTLIFLLHYWLVGQAVYGDGIYYFAYARSMIKDHDINFLNEKQHHYSPANNNTLHYDSDDDIRERTKTGMVPNKYPIGAPLLWIPAFVLVDLIANILHFFNPNFPNNGYSNIYQVSIGIVNIFFVVLGLKLLYTFLTNFFQKPLPIYRF